MAQHDQVQGVLVEILGEEYRIGGEPEQVQRVAAYVDAKMREISARSPRMPRGQVALLTAMEVTAELFKIMSERKVFTDRANESIQRLSQLVEDRARMTGIPDADTGVAEDDDDVPARLASRLRQGSPVRLRDAAPTE